MADFGWLFWLWLVLVLIVGGYRAAQIWSGDDR